MSKTKRFYNKKRKYWMDLYHPYAEICMGHCRKCKKWNMRYEGKAKQQKNNLRYNTIHFLDYPKSDSGILSI